MNRRIGLPLLIAVAALSAATGLRAQFNYRSFTTIDEVTFNGDARKMSDRIRLVPADLAKRGSVWFNTKQPIADGFESTFTFQISEPGSREPWKPGADGLAFVMQNSSVYEGGVGGGIGYEGIANSLAVEFDTYDNNPDSNPEPNGNHVSVQSRGKAPNSADHRTSLGWTSAIPDLKKGDRHTARVRYLPGTLTVFLDDLDHPILTVPIRLDTLLSLDAGKCWIGFTAATGGSWANFDLFSLDCSVIMNVRNIYFDYDRATLKPASFPELGRLIAILKADPKLSVEIRGHTDDHGGDEYNQKLSKGRADAVRAYLIRNGIAGSRVTANGYGAGTPIATNETEAGRAENRRVEARLFKE
jgi:outer membrane protein OmpA-like peptidoglycan-associated protein